MVNQLASPHLNHPVSLPIFRLLNPQQCPQFNHHPSPVRIQPCNLLQLQLDSHLEFRLLHLHLNPLRSLHPFHHLNHQDNRLLNQVDNLQVFLQDNLRLIPVHSLPHLLPLNHHLVLLLNLAVNLAVSPVECLHLLLLRLHRANRPVYQQQIQVVCLVDSLPLILQHNQHHCLLHNQVGNPLFSQLVNLPVNQVLHLHVFRLDNPVQLRPVNQLLNQHPSHPHVLPQSQARNRPVAQVDSPRLSLVQFLLRAPLRSHRTDQVLSRRLNQLLPLLPSQHRNLVLNLLQIRP